MRDSYTLFFEHFNIKFEDIIKFGVEIDTIYPESDKIKTQWKDLIDSVTHGEQVYIRGYGRNAHATDLYKELYEILLGNKEITKDSTNNAKPTQLLQKITSFSKTIKKDNEVSKKISNYQVTHIFGRTKNPFLFTAPWNLVWKSKILDPFTGHESKGKNTEEYKTAFLKKSKEKYAEFIEEYNVLVDQYFSPEKIDSAFNQMKSKSKVSQKAFKKFKNDARNELKKIE
ncbi:hypothetical protein [Flavobacterium sp. N502536]|uniref:hypothetical protein n=1 Tax=Flavobacterium sp. N502536 TaxID=2986837 RepID=UPI002222B04C|nr:hypothetical protein [Flavobacterium sp. N502536]